MNNDTGRVAIEKPLAPDLPDTTIPWVIVDEVQYFDQAPWPLDADGLGDSLYRNTVDTTTSSRNPASWSSGTPDPGQ